MQTAAHTEKHPSSGEIFTLRLAEGAGDFNPFPAASGLDFKLVDWTDRAELEPLLNSDQIGFMRNTYLRRLLGNPLKNSPETVWGLVRNPVNVDLKEINASSIKSQDYPFVAHISELAEK